MAPTLETTDGTPVDVTPVDPESVNAAFQAAMLDDGPDEQALPKRQRRTPAADADGDAPKPRRGRPAKEDRSRTTAKAPVVLDDAARREGVKGFAQIGAALALGVAKATGNAAWLADAVTIESAAGDIADACAKTAAADPRFAAALDRVCNVGPYAALITVGFQVGSQLARNHRPQLTLPGTVHPDELLKQLEPTAA